MSLSIVRIRRPFVPQTDLQELWDLDQHIEHLQKLRRIKAAEILGALCAGAEIQPGARAAAIHERLDGGIRRQRLIVK